MTEPFRLQSMAGAPRRRTGFVVVLIAGLLALALAAALAGYLVLSRRTSGPDVAACKAAIQQQYRTAQADVVAGREPTTGIRPAACEGVDDATLERLAGEVLKEESGG